MGNLNFPIRYFQDSTPADVPCRESSFVRREFDVSLPVERVALILVDLWNVHFIESWIERAERITLECVVPAIEAARRAGITVIHAPSPPVADKSPKHRPTVPPRPAMPSSGPSFPPQEFRGRQGEFARFIGPRDQPPGIGNHWNPLAGKLDITPHVTPLDGEIVISDKWELHHVLAELGAYHLVYAGFATNWCLLGRDYGIRSMSQFGYHLMALRDATTGVEFPDTLEHNWVTEVGIREIEQQYGFTASTADFIRACDGVG